MLYSTGPLWRVNIPTKGVIKNDVSQALEPFPRSLKRVLLSGPSETLGRPLDSIPLGPALLFRLISGAFGSLQNEDAP